MFVVALAIGVACSVAGLASDEAAPEDTMVMVEFTVREGHREGRLVESAEVRVLYVSADGATEIPLGQGKTDVSGRLELSLPRYDHLGETGTFNAEIVYAGQNRLAPLPGFPQTRQFRIHAPVRAPGQLIRVTLESGGFPFAILPEQSIGVDVVNVGGKAKDLEAELRRITLEALPGAVAGIFAGEDGQSELFYLPLASADDGKTIRLRVDGPLLYRDNRPCFLDLAAISDARKAAEAQDATEEAKEKLRRFVRAFERLWKNREIKEADQFGMMLDLDDIDHILPILRELKGSGTGIYFSSAGDESRSKVSKEFVRAVGEVNPRQLMIDCQGFADLDGDLPGTESLCLLVRRGERLPDLSKLKRLRHLYILAEDDQPAIDLGPLRHVPQLQSLNVWANRVEIGGVRSLSELQFLTFFGHTLTDVSVLNSLPRLRYLTGRFALDTDFSFVERLPYLQTLAVLDTSPHHRLDLLARAPRLRCLALRSGDSLGGKSEPPLDEIKGFRHVRRFQEERPEVEIMEYRGLCLGSWWFLVALLAAAVLARAVRRHRMRGSQRRKGDVGAAGC